jgi:hypothetical protein
MKQYKNIVSSVILIAMMLISNSCSDLLVEKPQSNIVPSAFGTPSGLLAGIAGVYNNIRNAWGTEGFTVTQMIGTDETLEGGGASNYHVFATYNGMNGGNTSGGFGFYSDINALNGILELGPTAGLDAATLKAYLGQAQFLRAFLYFYLVQTYGNIPLHTTFITTPSQADAPAPPNEIYKVIVQDLTDAISNLPNTPTAPFLGKAATAGAAKWLLAKVYLTRGWLNNAPADFTLAYNTATDLITNKGTYGYDLWADYANAFLPANDYGKETIFVSDHSNDPKYGYYNPNGAQAGGIAINVTPWMGLVNMPSNIGVNSKLDPTKVVTDPTSLNPLYNPKGFVTSGTTLITRDVQFGRPFGRIRPNPSYLLSQAFADRANDSRYWKTFQVVWLLNSGAGGGGGQAVTGTYTGLGVTGSRGQLKCGVDTAIWYSDYEVVGAPTAKGSWPIKGVIITPSMQYANAYPYMKKLADPSRVNQNDPSTRPVVIARFSDVYLIAAEAAFKLGDNVNAAANLNIVRQRAAYHSGAAYVPGGAFGTSTPATMVGDPYPAGVTAGSAITAMTVTPAQVTLDFILDERTREFYGESVRWLDLVRTQSLVTRIQAWNPQASPKIQTFHMLRPIPQDLIQNVTAGEPYPQNPGY